MPPAAPADPHRFTRAPAPQLAPYVARLWAIDEAAGPIQGGADVREHVLPTGSMHVAFRLREPLRVYAGDDDARGEIVGDAVVGGARTRFYVRDVSRPLSSVGAQLRPGAAAVLFGAGADELAERHTPLELLWGGQVETLRERLAGLCTLEARVEALEQALLARLTRPRAVHPAVAQALAELCGTASVSRVVRATGYSHRTFLVQFRREVGIGPKEYCRVLRFGCALRQIVRGHSFAGAAAAAGFSDQAHFSREFRAFAGVPPIGYRRAAPRQPYHVRGDGGR